MTEPADELEQLRQELSQALAENTNMRNQLEQANQQLEQFNGLLAQVQRIPELEEQAARANSLGLELSDMTQERNRLRQLLLGILPSLDDFNVDYPQATIARSAFDGATPEEIAEKMALWDAARTQKTSEWNALKNNVRTQATV